MDVAVRTTRLPKPGETLLAETIQRSGGGKGANQAVGAARAGGADTAMVGAVGGSDGDGDTLLDDLRRKGIDVTGIRRVVDHPTGVVSSPSTPKRRTRSSWRPARMPPCS